MIRTPKEGTLLFGKSHIRIAVSIAAMALAKAVTKAVACTIASVPHGGYNHDAKIKGNLVRSL